MQKNNDKEIIDKNTKIIDPLSYPIIQYPICFFDYLWVITIYISLSFFLSLFIQKYIFFLPFDKNIESHYSIFYISIHILIQFSLQGFIAIMLNFILQKIPSPFNNLLGYNIHTNLGVTIRNPAIISVILFALSTTLRDRLLYLYDRVKILI